MPVDPTGLCLDLLVGGHFDDSTQVNVAVVWYIVKILRSFWAKNREALFSQAA